MSRAAASSPYRVESLSPRFHTVDARFDGNALTPIRRPQTSSTQHAAEGDDRAHADESEVAVDHGGVLDVSAFPVDPYIPGLVSKAQYSFVCDQLRRREAELNVAAELGDALCQENGRLETLISQLISDRNDGADHTRTDEDADADTSNAQLNSSTSTAVASADEVARAAHIADKFASFLSSELSSERALWSPAAAASPSASPKRDHMSPHHSASSSLDRSFGGDLDGAFTGDVDADLTTFQRKLRRERRFHEQTVAQLTRELESKERHCVDADETINTLTARISAMAADVERIKSERDTAVTELNERIHRLTDANALTNQTLTRMKRERELDQRQNDDAALAESELSRVSAALDNAQQQLVKVTRDHRQSEKALLDELASKTAEAAASRNEQVDAERAQAETERVVGELKESAGRLSEERDDLRRRLIESETRYENGNKQWSDERKRRESEALEFGAEVERLQNDLADANTQNTHLLATITALRAEQKIAEAAAVTPAVVAETVVSRPSTPSAEVVSAPVKVSKVAVLPAAVPSAPLSSSLFVLPVPQPPPTAVDFPTLTAVHSHLCQQWRIALSLMPSSPQTAPAQWVPDLLANECMQCHAKFGVATWKHHCRLCGGIYCQSCAQLKTDISKFGLSDARLCSPCYSVVAVMRHGASVLANQARTGRNKTAAQPQPQTNKTTARGTPTTTPR